ncbi:AAA family ATPase [Candidatus Woesearchaeota archaeon]|nr:AAA family ATPase [Candidatus Woesearchaeota archaeon]
MVREKQSYSLSKEKRIQNNNNNNSNLEDRLSNEENIVFDEEDISNPKVFVDKIEKSLNSKIKGQEHITKRISRDVYRHFIVGNDLNEGKIDINDMKKPPQIILLIGKSSMGKSYLGKTIGELFNFPYGEAQSKNITEVGYVGNNIEDAFESIINNARKIYLEHHLDDEIYKKYKESRDFLLKINRGISSNDNNSSQKYDKAKELVEKIEEEIIRFAENYGVLIFDEFDKLAEKNSSNQKVNGKGVQDSLLSYLGGTNCVDLKINDEYSRNPLAKKTISYKTNNTFIILTGAFEGIEDLINDEDSDDGIPKRSDFLDYYKEEEKDKYKLITLQHLEEYGINNQLLQRITSSGIYILRTLEKEDFKEIFYSRLDEIKNNLNNTRMYPDLFQFSSVKISERSLNTLVDEIYDGKQGCRIINKIIEELPKDIGLYVNKHENDFYGKDELIITPELIKKVYGKNE